MPSVLAHYIFLKEGDKNLPSIANIGAQGPDPFFFNVIALKNDTNNKRVTSVGHFMHNVDPFVTFEYCMNYIMNADEKEKPILLAYFKGMLAHYSLDSVAHPYIFYKSGFVTDDESKAQDFFYAHASIETMIDANLKETFKCKTSAGKAIKAKKKELKIVSKMLYHYLNDVWHLDYVEEDSFYKAARRMHLGYSIIYSHTGFRKSIYRKLMKVSLINVLSTPKLKDVPPLDFLNLKHEPRYDCVTGDNEKTTNFYEIFDEGIEKFHKFEAVVDGILAGTSTVEDMRPITRLIDHDGKRVGSSMRYYKLIWDELEKDKK